MVTMIRITHLKRKKHFIFKFSNFSVSAAYSQPLYAHSQSFLCHNVLFCAHRYNFNNPKLEDVCVAWRKSMQKIWKLPLLAHCFLLHLISGCLPVFNELCQRSMSFVRSCLAHDSYLIRFVANYVVVHARSQSFLRQNALFCAHPLQIFLLTSVLGLVHLII